LRTGTQAFSPLAVTESDLRDPGRLKELGVTAMLEGVRQTLTQATRLCYNDYPPSLVERRRAWVAELDERQASFHKERNAALRSEAPLPPRKEVTPPPPIPTSRPAERTSTPVPTPAASPAPSPASPTHSEGGAWAAALAFLATLAGVAIVVARRRTAR